MQKKPNIIFILSDQQRWDTVGAYGQPLDITPNLDKMAKEGVRFENAFTCQPVCGPARSCIQSGKYSTETGCYRNDIALPPKQKTIAHYLSEQGYKTGYVGKWHLASTKAQPNENIGETCDYSVHPVPLERRGGYNDFWLAADILEFTSHGYGGYLFNKDMQKVEFEGYRVDCLTDYVLDYLRTETTQQPFFLFVSYLEPHHQNDHNRYEGPDRSKEKFKNFVVPEDLKGTGGDWRKNYPDYLGCCNSLDKNLGRIRDELKLLGKDEDTVIVYTSDHGSHFRTRNGEYKRSCHENSIRIPMIAYGPGFEGGKVNTELVSLIDIAPTILDCAGIEKPCEMRGNSLKRLVNDADVKWTQSVFIQISENQVGRAVRTKEWKYSVKAANKNGQSDSSSDVYTEDFLYGLVNDPHERNNLVALPGYDDIKKVLSEQLKQHMSHAGERTPIINTITTSSDE